MDSSPQETSATVSTQLPSASRFRTFVDSLVTSISAFLGVSLWIGLLTPLSWLNSYLNFAHCAATGAAGLLAFSLGYFWGLPRTLRRWILLIPSLAAIAICPFLWVISQVLSILGPSDPLDLPEPTRVALSPDGLKVARLYDLGPGFGGGTRVTVKVSRQWLPFLVEDMGTIWSDQREAETGVSWEGNSLVIISIAGRKDDRVPLNMFQWYPESFITIPFSFLSSAVRGS